MSNRVLCVLEGVQVIQEISESPTDYGRVHYGPTHARLDADGCPRAYNPDGKSGLDYLANAGHPGNWYGIVTDDDGVPIIQGHNDPFPGFYVSATSYQWPDYPKSSPLRYLDSETIPFIVVSPRIRNLAKGVVLGCKCRVTYRGQEIIGVVGDIGPRDKVGELSIAAAKAIGIPSNPKTGGVESGVFFEFWPGVPAVIRGRTYKLLAA